MMTKELERRDGRLRSEIWEGRECWKVAFCLSLR